MSANIRAEHETLFESDLIVCFIRHGRPDHQETGDLQDLRAELFLLAEWSERRIAAIEQIIDTRLKETDPRD